MVATARTRDAEQDVLALARAVELLSGVRTAEDAADIVRTAARQLSGADGVAVVLRDGERVRYVDEDAVGALWKGCDFPIEACISGWSILHRERVVIRDVSKDPRIPYHLYQPTFVRSCVMTPVGAPEPLACIGAYWAEVRDPTQRELDSLDAIARATSVALENLRLQGSLRDAVRRAEVSSRAKSDFLTSVSHEIRTPLNGVLGACALLDATEASPEQRRLLEMLLASSAALEGVLKDVLDFARLQAETAAVEAAPFDLAETVAEVRRAFEPRFAAKGLTLRVDCAPGAGWALGDRGAVKQVLTHLVENACKFTDRGAATLAIGRDPDGCVRVVVSDTGPGIAPDLRPRLFMGFEKAEAANGRTAGGLGLGLAICRRLVELMGGSIAVESRLGVGSAFTVILPLPPAADPAARRPDALAACAQGAPPRVLVVDDHPTNRAVLTALLQGAGIGAVEAENGQQACDAFSDGRFDAVVMDIQMPVMDGLTATRRIRAIEQARRAQPTPIIMLTANALPEHVDASLAAGANRHLPKPISPGLLFAALNAEINGEAEAA